jgi:hypothetical protein
VVRLPHRLLPGPPHVRRRHYGLPSPVIPPSPPFPFRLIRLSSCVEFCGVPFEFWSSWLMNLGAWFEPNWCLCLLGFLTENWNLVIARKIQFWRLLVISQKKERSSNWANRLLWTEQCSRPVEISNISFSGL